MTEHEFLAPKPREQDALVAEKVMGWKHSDDFHLWYTGKLGGNEGEYGPKFRSERQQFIPGEDCDLECTDYPSEYCLHVRDKWDCSGGWAILPLSGAIGLKDRYWTPTTLMVDAWQVVEKMREEGWEPMIEYDRDDGLWYAWFIDAGGHQHYSGADSASLAICIAALKAVGEIE